MAFRKAVVFMQNAWSPVYAGEVWPRDSWLKALWRSHSGRRLRRLAEATPSLEFWWDNVTPVCGESPDSVVPADAAHVRQILREQNPCVVVAMGRLAETAVVGAAEVPVLAVPHPASRTLTNKLLSEAAGLLTGGFTGVVALRQRRGHTELEKCR